MAKINLGRVIRPKYKRALDKWNKETGGGDGTPPSFVNFCGGDRWLVWIFCKDLGANFLLANNAGGRMPKHLQTESGFDEDVSSMSGTSNKRSVIEDEVFECKKQRKEINNIMDRAVAMMEKNSQGAENDRTDNYINKVAEYSQKMSDTNILDTMSPDSKNVYVATLKNRRKEILKKMSEEHDSCF
jgi:hypothetical protein